MLKNLLKKYTIFDLIVLILIFFFLLGYFEPDLLLLKTTINGGDTGSHYPTAAYLKEVLLPKGKIMGWDPGNYAGYPLFYHYFPLAFLLMAALNLFISMEVSFKIISVLGIFLLPLFTYLALRFMKYKFPIPIIGAVFSLPFLFNQGNSMWGGNIPSALAGEFCYSLGFALAFLFFGSLYRGVSEKKYLVFNALLVFLIGFSHAYTFIFCLILGMFFVIDNFRNNLKYLIGVYGLGFLFLSFWLLPVVANLAYTTSFVFKWTLNSIFEIFPVVIIPFVVISVLAFFINRKDKRTIYFIFAVLSAVFIYFIGPRIGVLDIRLIPFVQFLLVIYAATFLSKFIPNLRFTALLPVIVFLAVAAWVEVNTTYVHHWISWNYAGYESKSTWPIFKGINDYLKKSGKGRVEWEHAPADESLGSIRSSETLPYFAKRQTLEGIHMLGAISAPFVFYIESETSYQSCNPLPNYFYSSLDLRNGIEHFKLFNVSHFVVRSDQVKNELAKFTEFVLEKSVGEYNIYRLLTSDEQFVEPLKNHPVLFLTDDWRNASYQWFAGRKSNEIFLVFEKQMGVGDKERFGEVVSDLDDVKAIPFTEKNVRVKSVVNDESIEIKTSAVGHPLLVKVSYHPNWKVDGADKIYFVSPCFMLIYPTKNEVRLSFEPRWPEKTGKALSFAGLFLAFLSPLWAKRFV
jgi:hypothetical protein